MAAGQVAITLAPELIKAIDEWRMSQPVPPSKSAAMAAMLAEGLKVFQARAVVPGDYSPGGTGTQ